MTEWISPVDRHRHYGEAGRASCAVCRLEAERDRLRAVVEATGDMLAEVLAHLDMSDDARTLLLDALEQATVALAGSEEVADG